MQKPPGLGALKKEFLKADRTLDRAVNSINGFSLTAPCCWWWADGKSRFWVCLIPLCALLQGIGGSGAAKMFWRINAEAKGQSWS